MNLKAQTWEPTRNNGQILSMCCRDWVTVFCWWLQPKLLCRVVVKSLVCPSNVTSTLLQVLLQNLKLTGSILKFRGPVLKFSGSDLKFRGPDLKFRGSDLKFRGSDLKFRGSDLKFRGSALNSEGQTLNSEGQTLNSEGQTLNSEGQTLNSEGPSVLKEFWHHFLIKNNQKSKFLVKNVC